MREVIGGHGSQWANHPDRDFFEVFGHLWDGGQLCMIHGSIDLLEPDGPYGCG